MRQSLFLFALLSLSIPAYAKTVHLHCEINPGVTLSQFDASANLEVADDNSVVGEVIYSTKANLPAPMSEKKSIDVKGKLTVYPAGVIYVNEVDSYELSTEAAPLITLFLNPGAGNAFSSRLLIDSKLGYVSHCEYQN